jgi:hypothetical protein
MRMKTAVVAYHARKLESHQKKRDVFTAKTVEPEKQK